MVSESKHCDTTVLSLISQRTALDVKTRLRHSVIIAEHEMCLLPGQKVVAGILRYRLVQVADFDRPAIGS